MHFDRNPLTWSCKSGNKDWLISNLALLLVAFRRMAGLMPHFSHYIDTSADSARLVSEGTSTKHHSHQQFDSALDGQPCNPLIVCCGLLLFLFAVSQLKEVSHYTVSIKHLVCIITESIKHLASFERCCLCVHRTSGKKSHRTRSFWKEKKKWGGMGRGAWIQNSPILKVLSGRVVSLAVGLSSEVPFWLQTVKHTHTCTRTHIQHVTQQITCTSKYQNVKDAVTCTTGVSLE